MELGKTNFLKAARTTDFGFFLADEEGNEVLLPNAYVPKDLKVDDHLHVFVYRDNEERLIATTLKPKLEVEQFAYLEVKQVNNMGAFADWGLVKQLLIPYSEQIQKLEEGKHYVIYLHLDEKTDRLIGSVRIKDFLFFDDINVKPGDEVSILTYRKTDLGILAIVNGMFQGMIFHSDNHKNLSIGQSLPAYVKQVRPDGKIDLVLSPMGYQQAIDPHAQRILDAIQKNGGLLPLGDKSDPDEIKKQLGMSKKAFKKALGYLYKERKVVLHPTETKLV